MSRIYLPWNASKARVREAEHARKNRAEIVRELSWGRVSRRDLIKMGLFTGAGMLARVGGLNPFVSDLSAQAAGFPRSPLFCVQSFTQPMPRFDVLPRNPLSCLTPSPQAEANETVMPVDNALGGGFGPVEGRPPGPVWAHQRYSEFTPSICVEATQAQATTNYRYNPQVASSLNSGIDPTHGLPLRFHPGLPNQNPSAVWTFNGTIPPKLVQARYGEPLLFRHHNGLPTDVRQNGGGRPRPHSPPPRKSPPQAPNHGLTRALLFSHHIYHHHPPLRLSRDLRL